MLFHPVVQGYAYCRGRYAGDYHLPPQAPGAALLFLCLLGRKRIELPKKQHAYSQDGSQLDDHQKHVPEVSRHIERHELVEQQHVARARYWQPFRNSLNQSKEGRLKQLYKIHRSSQPFTHAAERIAHRSLRLEVTILPQSI